MEDLSDAVKKLKKNKRDKKIKYDKKDTIKAKALAKPIDIEDEDIMITNYNPV